MELVDTHCHLPGLEHCSIDDAIKNAAKRGVMKMICVGASKGIETARQAVALAEKYDNVWASIGVHPHDAGDFTSLEKIEDLADHPRVVAIGETGLDFFRDWAPVDNQYELFSSTITLALEVKKPLIIHCRDADEECLKVLKECGADKVGGVFHCFAGNLEFADRAFDLNFIVSITGVVTFKSATGLRETVRKLPLDRFMLETDCPYMAPEPYRGKPSEPAHVYQIAEKIAEVKGLSIDEIAKATSENAKRLFGL